MSSAATLAPVDSRLASTIPRYPVVFINGCPREDVRVTSLTVHGPLDFREADLTLTRNSTGWDRYAQPRLEGLIGGAVEVVLPVLMDGGDTKAVPLFRGSIVDRRSGLAGRRDELEFRAVCGWQTALTRPAGNSGDVDSLTIEEVLERLNASHQLRLTAALLPLAVRTRVIEPSVLRLGTPADILKRVFEENALCIHCDRQWTGTGVIERRSVRSLASGRPVRLGLTELANPLGSVEAMRVMTERRRPAKLVVEAAGQTVESTFELLPGWDPAMEGLVESEYAKSTSSDFDAVVNVHRLWVLNEDGRFAGPAFDLTEVFDEGRAIPAAPLRFGGALTRDEAGRGLGVVIEVSTDGGDTWTRHAGAARVLTDRGGVYFEDDVLPSAYISGPLRVRVTATLRCPLPLQQVRWRGNPFAGAFEEMRWKTADLFAWRRVADTSRYAAAVAAGERTADQVDDRVAMAQWLIDRLDEPLALLGQVVVHTTGVAAGLRIGDRMEWIAGRRLDPGAGGGGSARLVRIRHRFDVNGSELTWQLA